MYRLYRKMTMNGHFSIQSIHFCLDITRLFNTVYVSDPNNRIITRLWCTVVLLLTRENFYANVHLVIFILDYTANQGYFTQKARSVSCEAKLRDLKKKHCVPTSRVWLVLHVCD